MKLLYRAGGRSGKRMREPNQVDSLVRDFQDMQVMLFGNPPSFDSILQGLGDLEKHMNAVTPTRQAGLRSTSHRLPAPLLTDHENRHPRQTQPQAAGSGAATTVKSATA